MEWLEPWVPIADLDWPAQEVADYRAGWERQLAREVGPRHILRGLKFELIARRFDTDDALFRLLDGGVAEVHLTWARGEEPDPRWPATSLFDSLEQWARESMIEQNRDWIA